VEALTTQRPVVATTTRLPIRTPEQRAERTAIYQTRAGAVHKGRYIYGSEPYGKFNGPIAITCRIHGLFSQRLDHHLRGAGCPRCGAVTQARAKRRGARERFADKATLLHNGRYDYSMVDYFDARTEVTVMCRRHGPFTIQPTSHLNGRGCRGCGYERVSSAQSVTQDHVLSRYAEVHGDRYDYSLVRYVGSHHKVTVVCLKHGPFETTSSDHAAGTGCPPCSWDKVGDERRFTAEQLMERLRQVHGTKYSYDLTGYKNNTTKLRIACPDHGEFRQEASSHLTGAGCPQCAAPRGEKNVAVVLTARGISFVPQFMHDTCRGEARRLPFDFAIPSQRVLIEFDGIHHRKPVRWASSITQARAVEMFKHRQHLDGIKTRWAASNGWTLIRLSDKDTVEADLIAHGVLPQPQMTLPANTFEALEDEQETTAERRSAMPDPMAGLMGYDENGRPLKGAALAASQSRQLSNMAGRASPVTEHTKGPGRICRGLSVGLEP
jgi:hypothetical protein